ncbi:hypothetical protein EDC01DRAFT_626568 [Geopyxis carbonaria]|nr:hypothetical protein EDC01DRAFT_626568 [Geopyxis carbonaria]
MLSQGCSVGQAFDRNAEYLREPISCEDFEQDEQGGCFGTIPVELSSDPTRLNSSQVIERSYTSRLRDFELLDNIKNLLASLDDTNDRALQRVHQPIVEVVDYLDVVPEKTCYPPANTPMLRILEIKQEYQDESKESDFVDADAWEAKMDTVWDSRMDESEWSAPYEPLQERNNIIKVDNSGKSGLNLLETFAPVNEQHKFLPFPGTSLSEAQELEIHHRSENFLLDGNDDFAQMPVSIEGSESLRTAVEQNNIRQVYALDQDSSRISETLSEEPIQDSLADSRTLYQSIFGYNDSISEHGSDMESDISPPDEPVELSVLSLELDTMRISNHGFVESGHGVLYYNEQDEAGLHLVQSKLELLGAVSSV